jgi:hypothetical protein
MAIPAAPRRLGLNSSPAVQRSTPPDHSGARPSELSPWRAVLRLNGHGRSALGVLLVLVCASAGALLAARGTPTASYLELSRSVTVGQPLQASDLESVRLEAPASVALVPSSDERLVLGEVVAGTLPVGALLSAGEVQPGTDLRRGQALVGANLATGELPAAGLLPGELVLVIGTGGAAGASDTPDATPRGTILAQAVVVAVLDTAGAGVVGASGSGAGEDVSLVLPISAAPSVAAAAAAGTISVAIVPTATSEARQIGTTSPSASCALEPAGTTC